MLSGFSVGGSAYGRPPALSQQPPEVLQALLQPVSGLDFPIADSHTPAQTHVSAPGRHFIDERGRACDSSRQMDTSQMRKSGIK